MKLLVAAVGDREDDFAYTVPGEVVMSAVPCDRDLRAGGECGCSRAFIGLASGRATTAAVVADVEMEFEELLALLRTAGDADREWLSEDAEWWAAAVAEIGADCGPVGTMVKRRAWLDDDDEIVEEIDAR